MKSAFSWQEMSCRDDITSNRNERTSLSLGQLIKLQKVKFSVIDLTDLLSEFFLSMTVFNSVRKSVDESKNKMAVSACFSYSHYRMQRFSSMVLCELEKNQFFIQYINCILTIQAC